MSQLVTQLSTLQPLPNKNISDSSKLEKISRKEKKSETGKNKRKLFDWLEKNLEKVQNAGIQHLLLFPQCVLKVSVSWLLTLYHTIPTFNDPKEEGCGKHCGKRRNCW